MHTLNYSVCLNGTIKDVCFDEVEVVQAENTDFVDLTLLLTNVTLESLRDSSNKSEFLWDYIVQVHIKNECGQNVSEAYNLNSWLFKNRNKNVLKINFILHFHYTANGALNCASFQPNFTNSYITAHVPNVPSMSSVTSTVKEKMNSPGEKDYCE